LTFKSTLLIGLRQGRCEALLQRKRGNRREITLLPVFFLFEILRPFIHSTLEGVQICCSVVQGVSQGFTIGLEGLLYFFIYLFIYFVTKNSKSSEHHNKKAVKNVQSRMNKKKVEVSLCGETICSSPDWDPFKCNDL